MEWQERHCDSGPAGRGMEAAAIVEFRSSHSRLDINMLHEYQMVAAHFICKIKK